MVSSVKEKDITLLQEAGYLAKEVAHQLPTEGQIVPTPEPHERVLFISHFVRGWDSLSTRSSAESCSTIGWTSMI